MDHIEDKDTQGTQPLPAVSNEDAGSDDTVPRLAVIHPGAQTNAADLGTSLSQDELATPTPIPLAAQDIEPQLGPRRGSIGLWLAVGLSLALSLASLALNAVLIYQLLNTRQKAIAGFEQAIAALDNLATEGFHYEYTFDQTVPFSGDIPFEQDILFPFEGTIPFNTTVTVPVDMGLFKTEIDVPVDTSVYVNTAVPIHVDETIHVDTEIPVSMTIPIDIEPGDPEIQQLVNRLRDFMVDILGSF